jgi:hypothetical protein
MPERNAFLLRHNTRPHFSASSGFWLFPKFKETIRGQQFSLHEKVEKAVRKRISSKPETFFMGGMNKVIDRLKNV